MPAPVAFAQAKVMLPQGIEYLPDVEYASVMGYRPLTLDLYLPADKTPKPVVIYIHGGGFETGSKQMPKTPAGDWPMVTLASRGYVVVGVAYRMSGEAKFPVAVQDVKAAIRFLRAHATEYNLDPKRIGVWGESAGGYLTALVATSCGAKEFEGVGGNANQSSCVQAAVDWFGPIDFTLYQKGASAGAAKDASPSAITKFLGCDLSQCDAAILRSSNPINFISKTTPPILIMQGAIDKLVPPQQSQAFYDSLKAKGAIAKLILEPGAGHGWEGASAAQSKEIYETAYRFFDKILGGGVKK